MSKSSLTQIVVPADEGNYTKGRDGRSIEAITIHHMAGRLTAEQCGRIFQAKVDMVLVTMVLVMMAVLLIMLMKKILLGLIVIGIATASQ